LSCIWTCLHNRGLCCSWRCLHQGPSCIWTCLHYRHVPTYCRKCSLRFENNLLTVMSDMFTSLRK
jgi:hypothetical protein